MDRFALASQAVIYVVSKSEQPAKPHANRGLLVESYYPGTEKSRVPIDSRPGLCFTSPLRLGPDPKRNRKQ